ncbi:hypothetical protein KIW84_072194 [Lathyrus oleraceus]|uniref:RING-type domain-containing protein n=2 Tax=Pisum sativum TaxID=3888 RepID=A0A9D4VKD9_PEA|nr:hypothetical protein KIW84_072194 [Pisum sativum]
MSNSNEKVYPGPATTTAKPSATKPVEYLSNQSSQREAVEALIQELPKFMLKVVPTDCSECPICLEEFRVGNKVHGLPCAHNFHVECIDEWLRLNVKCHRCRCSVFPNSDLSAPSNLRPDSERSSASVVTTTSYKRNAYHDLAMAKLKEGNVNAASELFQRAVHITPLMAHKLIQTLKSENIEFVVAPPIFSLQGSLPRIQKQLQNLSGEQK